MTLAAEHPDNAPPARWMRIALIVIAAIESIGALRDIPALAYEFNPTTAIGKFAQALTSVNIVLSIPIALAALYFAAAGKLRLAIAAIAARVLVTWLCDTPTSVAIHGIEWSLNFGGLNVAGYQIGAPIVALAALYLAWRNEPLALATLLVALPTIFSWLNIAVFTVAVMIYGF